jgi:hypothetical protein
MCQALAAKKACGLYEAASAKLPFRNYRKAAFVEGKGRKEKNFSAPERRKPLISLESMPNMEGEGRKRSGDSGLDCLQLHSERTVTAHR